MFFIGASGFLFFNPLPLYYYPLLPTASTFLIILLYRVTYPQFCG